MNKELIQCFLHILNHGILHVFYVWKSVHFWEKGDILKELNNLKSKHLLQEICIKTILSIVYTGGAWHTGGGGGEKKTWGGGEKKKKNTGGGGEKTGGGGEKKTCRRRRSPML